ncbi:MAG TPA: M23 family metallopeptidase, partial [Ardenticatenaceae bacterium]|nr:M23 family metallopeptidase [Ardenticatenaceae bacterium]
IGTGSPIHALEQREGSNLQSPAPDRAALVARYGDQTWDSLEAMPPEVRAYFERTIEDVAAFFNVRAGDVAGILRAEQNDKGWTLQESGVSSAGATGVAQVVARTWNGWSNPEYDSHSRSLADIERYGGLGFDWAAREQWRAWKQGRVPLSALEDTNADPTLFENGVAAIARHLVHWDLTRDVYAQDAAAFDARLGDAIAVYNSGRPLSESRNFTQSSANRKTVGDYVAEVKATAQAWEGREAAPTGARLAASAGGRAENGSVPSVHLTATPASNGTAAAAVVEAVTGGTGGGDIPVIDAIAEGQTQPLVAIAGATEPLALALGNGSNGGGSGPVSVELRAAVPQAPIANARFRSYPLLPMPKVFKPFGTAVNYQAGGRHTGIDVAGPHGATLYAVADGVVTYVGPLYCDQANACRGQQAILLDLGDNTYAVYSHNSASFVRAGDRVVAGQAIGQQGNEGYSFGSHLHFEVHVGAPFSGDWHQPFRGGEFVDPMQFFAEA